MLGRAHALQRVNGAPLDHAHSPSHVNTSYAYLYVNLENQTYKLTMKIKVGAKKLLLCQGSHCGLFFYVASYVVPYLFLVEIGPNRTEPTRLDPKRIEFHKGIFKQEMS